MKNLIYLLILFGLTSCKDVLIEKPKSIAVETFYNTKEEVESALAAIYTPFRSGPLYGSEYIAMLECSTDYHQGRASWAPNSDFQGLNGTNMTRSGNQWNAFYLAIRNANLVIGNAPNGKSLTDEQKKAAVAEAKYLRALAYFQLVRGWGAIILRTEENMTERNLPKSSVADVYKLIEEDLLFAELHAPETAKVAGRVTKWAAKTLLADVYFHQRKNTEAANKAREVIQSGKYALIAVTVADDFNKVFGPDVVSSTEEIFYFKYSKEQQWSYPLYTHGVGTPYILGAGYMAIYSTEDNFVYKNWDNNDLRKKFGWYKWQFGLGNNTILNKKFSDPVSLQNRCDYPLYRYADVLLLFAEASCEAQGGPTSEGILALNMVHRRAYGFPVNTTSAVDYLASNFTKDSFIELVRNERLYETQAEGKRWLDLKRTGKAAAYIQNALGKTIAEKHYLFPIPISELGYNESLDPAKDQNPGY